MSRASHTIIGAAAGAGTSLLEQINKSEVTQSESLTGQRFNFGRLARSTTIGALAAMLPVPAKQTQRRIAAKVIALGTHWGAKLPPGNLRSDLAAALAGYGSHLIADACTSHSRS